MTMDRRLLAGAIGLVLAVAACGGSSTASSGATAAPTTAAGATAAPATGVPATEAPAPTDVPTATDEPTSTDDNGVDPSFAAGAASDLEAMLPDEAGGVTYQTTSFDGASLGMLGASVDTAQLNSILSANGKTISDVRVAIAAPADSSSSDAGMVLAFQIRGLDASKFMEAMGADPATMTKTSLGGKDVYQSAAGGIGGVFYPKDDILFAVLLASDRVAEAIVQQLP